MKIKMKLIETKTLASSAGSIEFTDIPQDFTDLYILTSLRCNSGGTWVDAALRFNDSTTSYSERGLSGNGTSTASFTSTGVVVRIPSPGFTANTFSNDSVYIPNYTGSSAKGVSIDNVTENNGTTSLTQITAGLWNDSSAITKIVFLGTSGDLSAGSTVSLYGIGGAGAGYAAPKATGGTISYTDDGYIVHTFTASGTFTPTQDLTNVEYVVVAGGGGSGNNAGVGPGCGGGYRSSVSGESSGGGASAESSLSLTNGINYTVTVGGGGAAGTDTSGGVPGSAGSNSVFNTITSTGGGYGGVFGGSAGSGGSGGGAGGNGIGGGGTTNQGFYGGSSTSPAFSRPAGGGGAGAAGQNGNGQVGGNGGAGISSSITGTAVGRAGGGAGTGFDTAPTATSGGGGGGIAAGGIRGSSGTANTGGGGGSFNGSGGSGIVIVRYAA